jgi:prepilin-type N-terminal cleavage/methylation domain-containing protein
MARTLRKDAFTLIELLVVVAIIALLISILLPSLQGAREQGKKAVCLSNMSQIAKASHSYAVDDDREQMIPLHKMNVLSIHSQGWPQSCNKTWRTALPFAFGGRTAVKKLLWNNQEIRELTRDWRWGAPTRPLNRYVYGDMSEGDFKNLPMYHCPSDVGYPEFDPADWGGADNLDCPVQSAHIPCYDFVGNSYRINTCGLIWPKGGGGANPGSSRFAAQFSVGAEGHASSAIENPSRVAMYCDPLFYFWSRQSPDWAVDPEKILFQGWHKKIMADNVAFCDGSAKLVKIDSLAEWDLDTLEAMNFSDGFKSDPWYFLRRGRTWQTDCYPSPGSLLKVYNPNGTPQFEASEIDYTGWPFDNFTQNLCPI